jgi:hypothetical protein
MNTGHPVHRCSKKKVVAPVVLLTTALAAVAVGMPAAQATDGTNAVFGTWEWSRFTSAQTDPAAPADPDGQAGEGNFANVSQIGEGWADTHDDAYRQKVSDGWVRFTEWQTSDTAPSVGANEEAGHRYERSVGNNDGIAATPGTPGSEGTLAKPGTPAEPGFWTNFHPNDNHGTFDGPPSYPHDSRGTWSAPKEDGGPHQDKSGVFQNGNGNGSWFYREQGTPATPGTPAVEGKPGTPGTDAKPETFHTEYQWDVYAFHYEYRWSVYERSNTPAEPAVVDAIDPNPSTDPTVPSKPSAPYVGSRPTSFVVSAEASKPSTSSQPHRAGTHSRAVPLSIDAGL